VPPQKLVIETPVGLTSVFMFECSVIRRRVSVGISATGAHSNKHRFKIFTSQRVHEDRLSPAAGFTVNQRKALAATASGKQVGDIHTVYCHGWSSDHLPGPSSQVMTTGLRDQNAVDTQGVKVFLSDWPKHNQGLIKRVQYSDTNK
jgi:hypothetical protein